MRHPPPPKVEQSQKHKHNESKRKMRIYIQKPRKIRNNTGESQPLLSIQANAQAQGLGWDLASLLCAVGWRGKCSDPKTQAKICCIMLLSLFRPPITPSDGRAIWKLGRMGGGGGTNEKSKDRANIYIGWVIRNGVSCESS